MYLWFIESLLHISKYAKDFTSHLLSVFLDDFSLFSNYFYINMKSHRNWLESTIGLKKNHVVIRTSILEDDKLGRVWVIVWFSASLWRYMCFFGGTQKEKQWTSLRKYSSKVWQMTDLKNELDTGYQGDEILFYFSYKLNMANF